jgi:hypothetical protein
MDGVAVLSSHPIARLDLNLTAFGGYISLSRKNLSRLFPAFSVKGGAHERFQAKWMPVRVKKTRQSKNLEAGF